MNIKALLFDKDGTLIDFSATFAPATKAVIADLSRRDPQKAAALAQKARFDPITETFDPDSPLIAGSIGDIAALWHSPMDDCTLPELAARIDSLYRRHTVQTLKPFDFLVPTLDDLRARGLVLGIATNDSAQAAHEHLEAIGIRSRFAHIFGYDSGYGAKPDPGMVRAFGEKTGLAMSAIAMIGDSLHDIEAGKRAGAVTIHLRPTRPDKSAQIADHTLSSISALPALLDRL